ncbi:MAG: hypothetical protein H0W72_06985 [Planctomycetes bacterium]|nr:hypothetical protein [Planctomycetota bacterium]
MSTATATKTVRLWGKPGTPNTVVKRAGQWTACVVCDHKFDLGSESCWSFVHRPDGEDFLGVCYECVVNANAKTWKKALLKRLQAERQDLNEGIAAYATHGEREWLRLDMVGQSAGNVLRLVDALVGGVEIEGRGA